MRPRKMPTNEKDAYNNQREATTVQCQTQRNSLNSMHPECVALRAYLAPLPAWESRDFTIEDLSHQWFLFDSVINQGSVS